jgi:peptidoglycan/xylan/chitin deacetylase (PgdA/CDA1 family)
LNDVLVLCYHGISPSWPAVTTVTPSAFEEHLKAFVARGYRPATLTDALTDPTDRRTMVVTFDDAHRSVLELAAPIMERLGIPGTVYVPTDYAGTDAPMGWDGYHIWLGTPHERELLCMGWEDLRGLAGRGWEIGSHTCSHPRLSRCDDETITRELTESKGICEERMEMPCYSFAYPYSDFDSRAVRAAAAAGYRYAVTVPTYPASPFAFEWPRVGAFQGEDARRMLLRVRTRNLGPSLTTKVLRAVRKRAG